MRHKIEYMYLCRTKCYRLHNILTFYDRKNTTFSLSKQMILIVKNST